MSVLNKLYIGTNTKMYKTIAQTEAFLTRLKRNISLIGCDELELFVIPSFTTLERAHRCVTPDEIILGAQNMGWEDEGPFSGEISPLMLKEVGASMVMIGHSERRHVLGETNQMENKKVLCALRNGITPLLCIGETAEEKSAGLADEVLRTQLKLGLAGVMNDQISSILIAYEPVWAIGTTGVPASKSYAQERHYTIRATVIELFGRQEGGKIPLLYGGSVNNTNAKELIEAPNIDGLFIGRSAWDADNFTTIIERVLPVWRNKR